MYILGMGNLAIAFLILCYIASNVIPLAFYQFVPVSYFYIPVSFTAPNICVGAKTQELVFKRKLNHSIPSQVEATVEENLYRLENGQYIEIYTNAFISPFGPSGEEYHVDKAIPLLNPGEYQWRVNYQVKFMGSTKARNDIPQNISNIFTVAPCN